MSLVALIIYCIFIGYRFSPEKPVLKMENGTDLAAKNKENGSIITGKERCGYLLFFLVSLTLIFNTVKCRTSSCWSGSLASWEIVLAGAVLMVVSGVLSSKEAFAAVPWDLGFLIAGSLCSKGSSLANTGSGDLMAVQLLLLPETLATAIWLVRYFIWFLFFLPRSCRTVQLWQPFSQSPFLHARAWV